MSIVGPRHRAGGCRSQATIQTVEGRPGADEGGAHRTRQRDISGLTKQIQEEPTLEQILLSEVAKLR